MKVTFLPSFSHVEVEQGTTLLDAIRKTELSLEASCGGNGTCGKCKVQVTKGNTKAYSKEEHIKLSEEEKQKGIRLACHCKVEEDMCVILNNWSSESDTRWNWREKEGGDNTTQRKASKKRLGIAMDIGTTTVELQVYDLETGLRLVGDRFMNPQRVYGADVISRITYCYNQPERVQQLRKGLLAKCNEAIEKAIHTLRMSVEWIEKIVIVCNTTMSHILVGESVDTLAKAPFEMKYYGGTEFSKRELPFLLAEEGRIHILHNIGGHVGADTFGCVLALGLHEKKGTYLLMDIGTNGEMVLAKDGELYACSTAAGPAFEGAGITYGMCAGPGAITKVTLGGQSETGEEKFRLQVIGNTIPAGISGSGIIDALACMLRAGIMDYSGFVSEEYVQENKDGSHKGVVLYKDKAKNENTLLVTREDIRQIQMAKAAIFAGAMSLLEIRGVAIEELDGIYLAGAFGSHIDISNSIQIGLLPTVDITKIQEVGNAALQGAKEVLVGKYDQIVQKQILDQLHHIELAEYEFFKEKFIHSMNFFY